MRSKNERLTATTIRAGVVAAILAVTGCAANTQPPAHNKQSWSYTIDRLQPDQKMSSTIALQNSENLGRIVTVCAKSLKDTLLSCDTVEIIGADGQKHAPSPENDHRASGDIKVTALIDGKKAAELADGQGTLMATVVNLGPTALRGVSLVTNSPDGVALLAADNGTIH